jgi:hypothetical protein
MFKWAKLPFKEAISYFTGKLINFPTQSWRDMEAQEHDWAFSVAGATKASLLADLRRAVEKSISEGRSLQQFKDDFNEIVAHQGWDHRGDRDWRAKTIYSTNLRTAYSAGRREQQDDPDVIRNRPYRMWVHGDSRSPRPHHLALDGKVFPADHPFWRNHYPPIFGGQMAWGCKCFVRTLSSRDLERLGKDQADTPPQPGELLEVTLPDGRKAAARMPSPSGEYVPGLSRQARQREVLQGMLDRLPTELFQQQPRALPASGERREESE